MQNGAALQHRYATLSISNRNTRHDMPNLWFPSQTYTFFIFRQNVSLFFAEYALYDRHPFHKVNELLNTVCLFQPTLGGKQKSKTKNFFFWRKFVQLNKFFLFCRHVLWMSIERLHWTVIWWYKVVVNHRICNLWKTRCVLNKNLKQINWRSLARLDALATYQLYKKLILWLLLHIMQLVSRHAK